MSTSSHKVLKSHRGKKLAKVNQLHGLSYSVSCDNSVCDSSIENMNMIFLGMAKDIVKDCNNLGIEFIKTEGKVIEKACTMVKRE